VREAPGWFSETLVGSDDHYQIEPQYKRFCAGGSQWIRARAGWVGGDAFHTDISA
jgi:hypothetical protein